MKTQPIDILQIATQNPKMKFITFLGSPNIVKYKLEKEADKPIFINFHIGDTNYNWTAEDWFEIDIVNDYEVYEDEDYYLLDVIVF